MTEPTTNTMRDAIEAAFKDADEPLPTSTEQPVAEAPIDDHIEVPESDAAAPEAVEQNLNELAEGEQQSDNEDVQQQPRAEDGKFKSKEEGITPGPKSGPKGEKAPASWRPEVREHWAQLPETVRSEIARRESEVARTLQETSEARKTAEAVMKTIAPYEAFIKAENSSPLQAIDNLMSTAARLRTGTAPELATLVAGIVQQFGVGRFGNGFIDALDSALAGQTPRVDPQQAAIDQVLNQRLAPLQNMFQQFQQVQEQQQQRVAQQTQSEVEQFLSKAEFGNDVREDMADLIEAAHRRGQSMTLKQAYDKACMLNDSVAKVMQQRRMAQGAQVQTQAAQRARSAAVSVSGSAPVGGLQQPATDVRSAIEAAITMSSR